jgi:hypothetical protein
VTFDGAFQQRAAFSGGQQRIEVPCAHRQRSPTAKPAMDVGKTAQRLSGFSVIFPTSKGFYRRHPTEEIFDGKPCFL